MESQFASLPIIMFSGVHTLHLTIDVFHCYLCVVPTLGGQKYCNTLLKMAAFYGQWPTLWNLHNKIITMQGLLSS